MLPVVVLVVGARSDPTVRLVTYLQPAISSGLNLLGRTHIIVSLRDFTIRLDVLHGLNLS